MLLLIVSHIICQHHVLIFIELQDSATDLRIGRVSLQYTTQTVSMVYSKDVIEFLHWK